jgi:hypothetical protein
VYRRRVTASLVSNCVLQFLEGDDAYNIDALYAVIVKLGVYIDLSTWENLKREHLVIAPAPVEEVHVVPAAVAHDADDAPVGIYVAPVEVVAPSADDVLAVVPAVAAEEPEEPEDSVVCGLRRTICRKNVTIKKLRIANQRLQNRISKHRIKDAAAADARDSTKWFRGKGKRFLTEYGAYQMAAKSVAGNVANSSMGMAIGVDTDGTTVNRYKVNFDRFLSSTVSQLPIRFYRFPVT